MTRACFSAVLLLAACLYGCGGKVYLLGADALDESHVAIIIKPKEDSLALYYKITTVLTVDGQNTGYAIGDSLLHVPPGERTLGVQYNAKDKLFSFRKASAEVRFTAEAGKTYQVVSKEDLTSVSIWVEDVASGERISAIAETEITIVPDADFSP